MKKNPTVYLVEGKCEEKLLKELKKEPELIAQGKVLIHNVLTRPITRYRLMTFKKTTDFCFVFDTDGEQNLAIYRENISRIKRFVKGSHVFNFVQIENLEDELLKATDLKRIEELTGSKSRKDFKTDFLSCSNCRQLLERHGFDIRRMWKDEPSGCFEGIAQGSSGFCFGNVE